MRGGFHPAGVHRGVWENWGQSRGRLLGYGSPRGPEAAQLEWGRDHKDPMASRAVAWAGSEGRGEARTREQQAESVGRREGGG